MLGWCSGLGVGLRPEDMFKFLLGLEAPWASHYLSASTTSQRSCEDKRKEGTMYTTLSFLKEGQYKNMKNKYSDFLHTCSVLCSFGCSEDISNLSSFLYWLVIWFLQMLLSHVGDDNTMPYFGRAVGAPTIHLEPCLMAHLEPGFGKSPSCSQPQT